MRFSHVDTIITTTAATVKIYHLYIKMQLKVLHKEKNK